MHMIKSKDITIIIPFHKNKRMLSLSIQTLLKTVSEIPTIMIIANNSDSKEIEINDELILKNCQVHKFNKELFWPDAINCGVQNANTKYVLFCDPDVFYLPNWLTNLCECYERHPRAGVVSPKIINPLTNRIMDFGMGYNTYNVFHTCKGLKYNHPITLFDRKVQAACGAVFLTEKELFCRAGGIDSNMPYIYCDNDYCLALSELGYETWVCANSHVYHKGNTDSSNSKYYAFSFLREDSKAAFYAKNISKRSIDLQEWLCQFWRWYKENCDNRQTNYVLLNFSTLMDDRMYITAFKELLNLKILDEYRYRTGQRDCANISLYNHIRPEMIELATPYLYFVDEFESLFCNEIWFYLRNTDRDLVIDKHGNIINMKDIACKLI